MMTVNELVDDILTKMEIYPIMKLKLPCKVKTKHFGKEKTVTLCAFDGTNHYRVQGTNWWLPPKSFKVI